MTQLKIIPIHIIFRIICMYGGGQHGSVAGMSITIHFVQFRKILS